MSQYGIHPLIVLPIVMIALFALGLVAERFFVAVRLCATAATFG